jgi:hypothetical protein
MDETNLRRLQGKLDGKSSYHNHVDQRFGAYILELCYLFMLF